MKKIIILSIFSVISYCYLQAQNPVDTIGIWSVINFDTTYNYIHIDTSIQNLWQVGKPEKNYFNSAYSPLRALVTDTVNNYSINNHSYFDLYIGNFNFMDWFYLDDIFIDFWHKYDTDTLKDGCYITVSWDKGQTWMNIIHDTIYFGASPNINYWDQHISNLYTQSDSLFNGESGFSGKSNGWIRTDFSWHYIPSKKDFPPDTMIIRFNFISDSINQSKEGWMIDNIRLYSIDIGGGFHNLLFNNNVNVYPNPFNTITEILLDKYYETVNLEVYNIIGNSLVQKEFTNCSKINFKRTDLGDGLFFFKFLFNKSSTEIKKVIITNQ